MSVITSYQEKALKFHKAAYLSRTIVAISILAFNFAVFYPDFHWWQWVVVLPYGLFYSSLVYFLCNNRDCERRTILFDAAAHGYFAGLWGFNPLIICVFLSAIIVTSIANGGLVYLRVALITTVMGMIAAAVIHGVQLRTELPLFATVLAVLATFVYLGFVSYVFYKLSDRLRQAKEKAKQQHAELVNINNITNAASSTLNLSGVMKGLMNVLQKIYPLESVFVLAYDTHKTGIDILGCYSDELTSLEKEAYKKFSFDVLHDKDSLYVRGMENNQIIYHQKIEEKYVAQGAQIDQELYAIRPSRSVVFFPISVRGKVIAGVAFVNYVHEMKLGTLDLDKIQGYLVQIGAAIRNVRMFYDVRRTRDMAKRARNQAEIAKRKAEESEDAKSHFLANMSHEIRTPMTAILGYSEALTDDSITNEEREEYTQIILRSGKHLLSIINDILDISKIEASKIEVEHIEVNFAQLISDLASYSQIKVKEKGLNLDINISYPIPVYINSDPTRLKQILFNLINNAVKFTEKGGVKINISQDNKQLKIEIIDSGIGLTSAEQQKLFKPFSQSDASVTRVHGGTGLGLYISQSLARLLGGDIDLVSKKGEGSCFTITVDCEQVGDSLLEQETDFNEYVAKSSDDDSQQDTPKLSGRVLIAEDNPENQRLMKRIIERTGLDVCMVDNGREAVMNASYKAYHIIFLDMQMPLMGGKEAAKRIRELGVMTPIIAFTANVMKHQLQEYKEAGFSDVVEKPIMQEKVYSVLKHYMATQTIEHQSGEVMIVEDNSVNQMVLKRLVNKASEKLNITLAENGREALDLAKSTEFDLILMDMEMPVMGGLEATKRLRESGFANKIYIVTGNVDPEHIRECQSVGADGHLAKPIDKSALYDVLDQQFKL